MAYFYEETVKVQLIKDIRELADKLDTRIEMPPFEYTTYVELAKFKSELQGEYDERMFSEKKTKRIL